MRQPQPMVVTPPKWISQQYRVGQVYNQIGLFLYAVTFAFLGTVAPAFPGPLFIAMAVRVVLIGIALQGFIFVAALFRTRWAIHLSGVVPARPQDVECAACGNPNPWWLLRRSGYPNGRE